MAKQYDIKYKSGEKAELRRLLKNYNAKISRVNTKSPELRRYQPTKQGIKSIESIIGTRKEFNKVKKELQSYSKRGVEQLFTVKKGKKEITLPITKYEVKKVSNENRSRNISRASKRKKQGLDEKRDAHLIARKGLKKKTFSPENIARQKASKQRTSFNKFNEQLEREMSSFASKEKARLYFQNYKDVVREQIGVRGDKIINLLERYDVEVLKRKFEENILNPFLKPDIFYSDEAEDDVEATIDKVYNEWVAILPSVT